MFVSLMFLCGCGPGDRGVGAGPGDDAAIPDCGAVDGCPAPAPCSCPTLPHATAGCSGGQCSIAGCEMGFGDCNHLVNDGCEVPLVDSPNCGGCGVTCVLANATPQCNLGTCTVVTCNTGFLDCNGSSVDGCEVDSTHDASHCGACNIACAAGQVCTLGTCKNPCDVLFTVPGGSTGAPAVGPDGTLYSVGTDGLLRAFAGDSGKVLWTSQTGSGAGRTSYYAIGGVAMDANQLYVGGVDGNLYAYDLKGNLAWKVPVGEDLSYATPAVGGAALGGAIVVSGCGAYVAAVSPGGMLKWKLSMAGGAWSSSPAIAADGTTYVAGWADPNLYAINPDGSLKWSRDNGGGAVTSPSIAFDGTVYVGNHGPSDGYFRAFNPDGTIKWKVQVGNFHGGSVIDDYGAVFTGNDFTLVSLNADGTVRWQASAGPGPEPWVCSGELIGDDGNIYVPVCGNKNLVVMERTNGNIVCTVPVGAYPSAPTVGTNGVMWVGSSDGNLIAFAGTSRGLSQIADWPKHHRDVTNSGRQK